MDDNDAMLRSLEVAVLKAADDHVVDRILKYPESLYDPATPGEELRLIKAVHALRRYRRQLVMVRPCKHASYYGKT